MSYSEKKEPSDLFFAHNCGIPFYTPDSIFLQDSFPSTPHQSPTPNVDFKSLHSADEVDIRSLLQVGQTVPEMVVLIGPPASGKSTLCSDHFVGYKRVNQDTLKTFTACTRYAKRCLAEGTSLVIDNTNATRAVGRAAFIRSRCDRSGSLWRQRSIHPYEPSSWTYRRRSRATGMCIGHWGMMGV